MKEKHMKEKINRLELKFSAMEATQKQLEKRIEDQNKTINAILNQHARIYDKIKRLETQTNDDRMENIARRVTNETIKKLTQKAKTDEPYQIKVITAESIIFTNGDTIHHEHNQDCCENNYADFEQIDDLAKEYKFRGELLFEKVGDTGFRFGDERCMFFVPCYSEQNGYYSNALSIFYNDREVLQPECEVRLY